MGRMQDMGLGDIEVYFHPEQVAWLKRQFPVRVFGDKATHEEMLYYNGQQSVLRAIENSKKR